MIPISGFPCRRDNSIASKWPQQPTPNETRLLDRWWLGTHQGAISAKHLGYYLDEYTFRFNRRRSRARGMLFYRLLEQSVQFDPIPYKHLVCAMDISDPKM